MSTDLQHVAIIMDGNRRWAKQRNLPAAEGHRQAVEQGIEPLIREAIALKIPYITFWAFSTENWKRDRSELTELFEIFRMGLVKFGKQFIRGGIKIKLIGELSRFPQDIVDQCVSLVNATQRNKKITVTFALNYGGRAEIVAAVKALMDVHTSATQLTPELLSQHLATRDLPDPDLIIRTGGEQRLSGFMPWQSVYSEILFVDALFPDFDASQFRAAIADFHQRQRRFGA